MNKKLKLEFNLDVFQDQERVLALLKDLGIDEDESSLDGGTKATLEFNLEDPYSRQDFMDALKGSRYKMAFDDVWDRVFRPYHKHGFKNQELNDLIKKLESFEEGVFSSFFDLLAEEYVNIEKELEE